MCTLTPVDMTSGQLLASPTFQRSVERLHKRIRKMRHGPDPEDMGGTNIESEHSGGP